MAIERALRTIPGMVLTVCLVLTFHAAALAAETGNRDTPIQVSEREAIAQELYMCDQAISRASALFEKSKKDLKNTTPAGWLAAKTAKGWATRLVRVGESGMEVIFEADIPEEMGIEGEVVPAGKFSPVEDNFLSSFSAAKDKLFKCSNRFVSIKVSEKGSGFKKEPVYFLASAPSPEEMVFGGHLLVAGPPEQNSPHSVVPLSNSCLSLDKPPNESSAVYVTHLLTDEPTEIHLFLSLKHKIPIYVGTKSGTWKVENGKAKLIETR